MPGFVAKASVVTAILHWTYHGIPALNVIDCRVSAGYAPNQSLVNTLNTAIIGAITSTTYGDTQASTSVYTGVGLRDMRTIGQAEILSTNGTHAGTGVLPALPTQVAMCITKRTALAGKFFRGRIYFGGFIQSANNVDGTINDPTALVVVNFATAMAGALTTNSLIPAVHSAALPERPSHAPSGGLLPAHDETLTDITSWVLRDHRWDTQRRRLQ
jgi:hypothetical protein